LLLPLLLSLPLLFLSVIPEGDLLCAFAFALAVVFALAFLACHPRRGSAFPGLQ
jgi:hypothetical protein